MKLSATRLFPLLLMLALAGLTFWLERTVREEEGMHPSLRRHDPDYIVDNLTHTRFNAQGAVESTLAAAKMLHYPDDDSTDLVAPRVVQTKPNEPRVTVTADRGDAVAGWRGSIPLRQRAGGARGRRRAARDAHAHQLHARGSGALGDPHRPRCRDHGGRSRALRAAAWSTTTIRRSCSCASGCAAGSSRRRQNGLNSDATD